MQNMEIDPLYFIFGISFFVVIIVIIFVAAIVYYCKRRRENEVTNSEGGSNRESSQPRGFLRCFRNETKTIDKREFKVEFCKIDPKESVDPHLTEKELIKLLNEIEKPKEVKDCTNPDSRVKISKIVQYTANDEITISSIDEEDERLSIEHTQNDTHRTQSQSSMVRTQSTMNNTQQEEDSTASSQSFTSSDKMDALLKKIILNGARRFDFKVTEIKELLEIGTRIFLNEPTLVEAPIPCVVYGDFHGQYSDLHRWFKLNSWPSSQVSVFLGDLVDRGTHGVEIIALLTALKIKFPKRVFIVRGNHEEETLNKAYNFYKEVQVRFPKHGTEVYEYFKNLFAALPLAVLIGGRILGMHGGLSSKIESLQSICDIERPLYEFDRGSLACDLVWSDPNLDEGAKGYSVNYDRSPALGIGQLFASDAVKEACEKLDIDLVIRGHQTPKYGYAFFADAYMMTLFSAPGYRGYTHEDINYGASIIIDEKMRITIKQIIATEEFRRKRIKSVDRLNEQIKSLEDV